MFVVDGVAGLAGALTNGTLQAAAYRQAGYTDTLDAYAYGWAAQSVALLAIGGYLVCGGRVVLRLVFQTAYDTDRPSDERANATSDLENNRG